MSGPHCQIMIKSLCSTAWNSGFFKASHVILLCIGVWDPMPCLTSPSCYFWDLTLYSSPLFSSLQPHWPPRWPPWSSSHSLVMLLLLLCVECSFQDIPMTPSFTFIRSLLKCQFINKAFSDHLRPPPWFTHPLFMASWLLFPLYICLS